MENNTLKYQAVEKSLSNLLEAGYTMNDQAYRHLVQERARLERTMKPDTLDPYGECDATESDIY